MTLRKEREDTIYKRRVFDLYNFFTKNSSLPVGIEVAIDIYEDIVGEQVTLEYKPVEIEIGENRLLMTPNGQFEPGTIRIRKEIKNEAPMCDM